MRSFKSIFKKGNKKTVNPELCSLQSTGNKEKPSSDIESIDNASLDCSEYSENNRDISFYSIATLSEFLSKDSTSSISELNKKTHLSMPLGLTAQNENSEYSHGKIKDIQCSICLETVEMRHGVRNIPCSHIFHVECLDSWMATSSDSCPTCRFKLIYHKLLVQKKSGCQGSTIDISAPKKSIYYIYSHTL